MRKRVRLPADVRRQQILDAALAEFSATGFAGATLDRIAQRVGLTKPGLYAHFEHKEAIFEALLVSSLFRPTPHARWEWREGATLAETVDRYLDALYEQIRDPRVQATMRLLISESGRDPERMRRWHAQLFTRHVQQRQDDVDRSIQAGQIADNAFSRSFVMASAPALLAMMGQLLQPDGNEDELQAVRQVHREMLLILLKRAD